MVGGFILMSIGLWMSRIFATEVTVGSKNFDLGAVQGVWDQNSQSLTLQGNGKIDRNKWFQLVNELQLRQFSVSKIEFRQGVQFPDDASSFFQDFKTENIIFPNGMDTSNVTNMGSMFANARNFNGWNISDWDVSKVKNFYETFRLAWKFNQDLSKWNTESATTMNSMFQGTRELTKPVNFENVSKVTDMGLMFHDSAVPSVNLKKTGKVQRMQHMFLNSNVETVTLDDTSSVENMDSMFESARNFNGWNISDWDVSKVKNFYETFRLAWKFNQDLSKWNTESATTMNSMFQGASNFNSDISKRKLGSLKDARGLIWSNNSFSQENYESFLQTLANSNISPKAMGKVIHVSATYCAQASLRNKLIARGFDLKDNGLDCQIKFDYTRPTLYSSGDIKDTIIKVSAKLPLDPQKITIDWAATTILYKDFNCKKGDTEHQVLCSIIFTGTNKGNKLSLKASMNVPISNWKRTPWATDQDPGTYTETTTTQLVEKTDSINGYIIDRIAPDKAQFTINTKKGIHNPVIRLANLPNDAGIGLDYCVMKTDDDTDYGTEKLKANTDYSLTLKSQETHSIWVKCYDKVGNHSENEVRFPPIVTFSEENRVLIKDGNITGEVKIYAPLNQNGSENLIDRVWVENSNGSNVNIVSCRDYNGKTNMKEKANFNNTPDKPLTCRFEWKFPEGKDSHDVQVKAQAANGAIWWNTQTFTRDEQGPEIIITPQSAFTGKNFTFEVRVFDAIGIVADGVTLDTDTSPGFKDGKLSCKPLSEGNQNTIICTWTTNIEEGKSIENWKISILARDKAGNETKLAYTNYTVDRQKPSISNLTFDYKEGTYQQIYRWSVKLQDQWPAGLWKKSQSYDPSALSYGVGDDEKCTNYRSISALNPGETEPYTLWFDFSDQNSNGKYLCIRAEDKVGNVAFLAHNDPVKVNLPPMIADGQKFTLPEHHHDREKNVKEIGEIRASDPNNDDLTYEIVGEDMKNLFEFKGNRLQTKPGVELDFENTPKYLVKVRVVDTPGLASKEGEIQISLTDIDEILPTVDPILDQRIKKNREVSIPVNATDAWGIRNIQVSGLPKGLFYNSKTKKIEGSTEERVRDQEVTVTVTDKEGNTISQKFKLTVAWSQRDDNPTTWPQCFGDCSVKDHSKTQEKPSQSSWDSETNKKQQPEEKKVEKSEEKLVHHTDSDIFNPTISDGQCYTRRPLHPIIDSDAIITSEEFKKAQSFLRSYEMTMFDSVDKYAPTRNLSRQEAAKMFSNFAINVLCRKPDLNLKVNYSDVENADPTLKPYITLAYQLGVMKWSGMGDGKFRPFDQISKAEVNAVLIRMILKSYLDESRSESKKWYSEYNKVATALGIINHGAWAEKISRNNTALMLFRAYKQQVFEWKNIDYFSYVLQSRDSFVK